MNRWLSVIWAKRVPQILGVYAAGAWGIVGFTDWLARRYGFASSATDAVFTFLLAMVPAVVLVAWYHGRTARQQVEPVEYVAIPINLALATLVAWTSFDAVPGRESGPRERSQLSYLGNADYATYSPEGDRIALIASDTTGYAVLVGELGEPTRLDTIYSVPEGSLGGLAWPEPDRIGVSSRDGTLALSPDGMRIRVLNPAVYFGRSADGEWTFEAWTNSGALTLTRRAEGGRAEVLELPLPTVESEAFLQAVLWSPVATVIAIERSTTMGERVDVLDLDGRSWRVFAGTQAIHSLQWAGDGSALHFVMAEDLLSVSVDAASGEPSGEAIRIAAGLRGRVSVSPDGRDLITTESSSRSSIRWIPFEEDGTAAYEAGRALVESAAPKWGLISSPDGDAIAYVDASRDSAIIIQGLDDGAQQVISMEDAPYRMAWSTDGTELAIVSRAPDRTVSRMSIRPEGPFDTIATAAGDYVGWCSEEVLLHQVYGNADYMVTDFSNGTEEPLLGARSKGWMFRPECSPDGERVAFFYNHRDGPGLWVIDLVSGREIRLAASENRANPYPVGWSTDGTWVYYYVNGARLLEVRRVPAGGGSSEVALRLPAHTSAISMARNASGVATLEQESISDLWLLRNFRSGN